MYFRKAVIEAAEETGRDPDPPPFHYGTHYSCAGYILHYLLRLEPFTRLALGLQGGRFDKPDRLFRDIRSSWESASSENLQVRAGFCVAPRMRTVCINISSLVI